MKKPYLYPKSEHSYDLTGERREGTHIGAGSCDLQRIFEKI
jgi:hypothetical protein